MRVIDEILEREGWPKFTCDPNDRGGATKGGITLRTLSGYLGRKATVEELEALDETTARKIYESVFVIRPGFTRIYNDQVREYLIDIGVTSGPARAVRYLQLALGGLKVDCMLGNKTAAAANTANQVSLLLRLVALRCRMMAEDVVENPSQLKYLEGWIRRAVLPLGHLYPEVGVACIKVAADTQDHPKQLPNLKAAMDAAVSPLDNF